MKEPLNKFWQFLSEPIAPSARVALIALIAPLLLSFAVPLWNISLRAPQYPQGLTLDIYLHKVEGGNDGQDIKEINTLNHYIGMAPINREQLSDLGWLPFAIGFMALFALRCAAIGNIRILIDVFVISSYISVFALFRFVYRLYVLGHNLDPRAPMDVAPFTPAILGTKQIANFSITSMPRAATVCIALYVTGVALIVGWHLLSGRRAALRSRARPAR